MTDDRAGADVDSPPTTIEIALPTEARTVALGRHLAAALAPGDLLFLGGDLGAGKTFLAGAIARGLGLPDAIPVTSPTFGIVHEYEPCPDADGLRLPLVHADLYRLGGPEALADVGLVELASAGDGVVLVEWADVGRDALPEPSLEIELGLDGSGGRRATVRGRGSRGRRLLGHLATLPGL